MLNCKSKISVLFEEPFWIALYEREYSGSYEVFKTVFGSEPSDAEVYEFFLKNYNRLSFSPPVESVPLSEHRVNPKRMRRQIKKSAEHKGMGTKAQQALKAWQELNKTERKTRTRKMREDESEHRFALRREKKKEKHKGH